MVRRQKYNCVLVSHELPDGRGIDFIEDVSEELLTTPVIGLSSSRDTADPIEYLRAGCIDFFYTDDVLDADKLRRGLARAMSRFHRRAMGTVIARRQLGDAVIKSQEGLIALARTDRLMGICNRGVFDDYFSTHHAEAVGRQGTYALCMIDVDNFKKYNDRYGHADGDIALRKVAKALSSTLRENDFIARYGGEEIVVLLDEVNIESAEIVGERLRRLVRETDVAHHENQPHGVVTVSIGIAVCGPGRSESTTEVFRRADAALYRAKDSGRNAVIVDRVDGGHCRMSA
jgi:diguanylate cyclase (GGDEF)-like protein